MSKVTNKELIDYCNSLGGKCKGVRCKYSAECGAYEKKYGDVPYLDDFFCPENCTDEVIVAESEDDE